MKPSFWIWKGIAGFLLFALGIVLFGYVTMYLWNWIMPYLFKLPVVDFRMAIGMVVLSKILLGGIRVKADGAGWGQKRYWRAKWESMSPEERDKFKHEFAERCKSRWGRVEVKVERTES